MVFRKVRVWLPAVLSALLLVTGIQQFAGGAPAGEPEVAPSDVEKGEMLRTGGSSYPRLVRLEHSGEANGRVLASMTTYVDKAGVAVIYESRDDGKTFQPAGEIRDPEGADSKGMCCSTLYELPKKVGDMPAGTLLWAGTAGVGADAEERQSSIRLWRSDDQGRTWRFVSDIVRAPVGPGVWEPELSVTKQGDLAAFYSDDGDPKHDQKLVQVRSKDGVNWTDLRDTVKNDKFTARPGMSGIRQLPNGTYVMVYEVCNVDPVHICTTWMRTSRDGWDYGDPYNLGTEIVSETGGQPIGTPTIAWAPGPGAQGRLLLAYQLLAFDDHGGLTEGNGRTLMVNDHPTDLAKGWREIPSPVQIKYNQGSNCRNFSPTLLPTADGKSVIHVTTDYEKYIGGPCEAFHATGPIDGAVQSGDVNATGGGAQPMDARSGR